MQAAKVAHLAELRKKSDAQRRIMTEMMEDQNKTLSRVNFEINTTLKIEQRRQDEAMARIREKHIEKLAHRRQQLANVYNAEFEKWSEEAMKEEETLEVRKQRLMTKAYALRDVREKERRDQVSQAYETIWRDGCDDLRGLDGKALDKFMGNEREKQIVEKRERKVLEEINANAYYSEWSKRLDAIANADKEKQDARDKANQQTAQGLKDQIQYNNDMRMKKYNAEMNDANQEINECQDAIMAEKVKRQQQKLDEIQRGKEVQYFNKQAQNIQKEKNQIEADRDAILLNNALKLEKQQMALENAKKREGAEAAQKYRKYLDEMMVKEAEDTGFVDEMNKREEEKVQKARDDALQARQDARDYLMKLVSEGRQEQIAYKNALLAKEKADGKIFASKFVEDLKAGIAKDKAEAENRRQMAIDNNKKLQNQIAERENQQLLRKQEVFIEDKRMRLIERKHQEKLDLQGGVVRLNFPKKRPDTR